jgi:putative ABC transport system substrate-binding protein
VQTSFRILLLLLGLARCMALAEAQPAKIYRIGVITAGGPYYHAVEGLRDGMKESGFEEGKQYIFHVRDTKGDLKAAADAARSLEQEKVDVIFSVPASVSLAAKRATTKVPIVFFAGSDPVESGLVKSFAKPDGRVTGIYSLTADLTGKRLEILKEISPKLRSVMTFYNPDNPVVGDSVKSARDAARQLGVALVERQVRSSQELEADLRTLKRSDADALFLVSDATIQSHAQLIIDAAKARKIPTMFYDRSLVIDGGLASYGVSYYAIGQLAAKYVRRVLLGTLPADLPVERSERFELLLNARTAREIGVTFPRVVVGRADEVIE